jgi:hypothetical protein
MTKKSKNDKDDMSFAQGKDKLSKENRENTTRMHPERTYPTGSGKKALRFTRSAKILPKKRNLNMNLPKITSKLLFYPSDKKSKERDNVKDSEEKIEAHLCQQPFSRTHDTATEHVGCHPRGVDVLADLTEY